MLHIDISNMPKLNVDLSDIHTLNFIINEPITKDKKKQIRKIIRELSYDQADVTEIWWYGDFDDEFDSIMDYISARFQILCLKTNIIKFDPNRVPLDVELLSIDISELIEDDFERICESSSYISVLELFIPDEQNINNIYLTIEQFATLTNLFKSLVLINVEIIDFQTSLDVLYGTQCYVEFDFRTNKKCCSFMYMNSLFDLIKQIEAFSFHGFICDDDVDCQKIFNKIIGLEKNIELLYD